MMRLILSGATMFAAVLMVGQSAQAQSLRSIGGPAETPPASFQGQQYVDSRGCVFMRAGLSGRVTWVPRIGSDRKPICNEVTPAQAQARLAKPDAGGVVVAQNMGQAPQKVGKPMETVASNITPRRQMGVQAPMVVPGMTAARVAAPVIPPQPAQPAVRMASAPQRAAGCPAQAPVMGSVPLAGGGSIRVCMTGGGAAGGWTWPSYRIAPQVVNAPGQQMTAQGTVQYDNFTPAWTDDRLNPARGQGTAQGWAAQDQVWTREVPAKPAANVATAQAQPNVRISASTRSAQSAGGGASYVQVGTFGDPSNVSNASGRLAAMGLPVAKSRVTQAGRALVIVLAGPFASNADAQSALGMARRAGFGDAFLR